MPSSVIRKIDYQPATSRLLITFVSGKTYAYDGVPPDVFRLFHHAPSKGEFFNAAIRDHYRCRLLAAEAFARTG